MAMVNVVNIAAYRWICWLRLAGLVQKLAATWQSDTCITWTEWTLTTMPIVFQQATKMCKTNTKN